MSSRKKRKSKVNLNILLETYPKQIIAGVVLLCALIVVIVSVRANSKIKALELQLNGGEPAAEAAADKDKNTDPEVADVPEESNDLQEDAYPEVNDLIQKYYDCVAAGDVAGIEEIVDVMSDAEKNYVESLKTLIEGYQNVHCYTKKGLEDGSYLVLVRFDLKFLAADALAPGLETHYVMKNDKGQYFIYQDTPSEELKTYVGDLVQNEDVQQLLAQVKEDYAAAEAADEKLAEYGTKLAGLKSSSETPVEEEVTEEAPEEQPAEEAPETSAEVTPVNKDTRFKETVRVRSERNTECSVLATAYQGEHLTRVEDYSDGWSKIVYNGKEGYCKTEFLE